ncbi:MAG: protein kinase [Eubacterium sp.]|nr:protein kinase [Eubacterium sp.]
MENPYLQKINSIIESSSDLEMIDRSYFSNAKNISGKMPVIKVKYKGTPAILKILTQEQTSLYQHLIPIHNERLERIFEVNYSDGVFYSVNEFIPRPSNFNYKLFDVLYKPEIDSLTLYEYITNYSMFEKTTDQIHFVPESIALRIVLELIEGLEELNANGLVHGDLSPQNILLTNALNKDQTSKKSDKSINCQISNYSLKIIDFGAMRPHKPSDHPVTEVVGTKEFLAPEILAYNIPNDRIDIYSIGCLLHYICLGMSPTECGPDYAKAFLSPGVYNIIKICNNEYSSRYSSLTQLKKAIKKEIQFPSSTSGKFFSHLPGFRTNKLWKKIIASLFYLWLIADILIALLMGDFSFNSWFFIAFSILEVIFVCDAFDIGGKIRSYNTFRREYPILRFLIKMGIMFFLLVVYWILWYAIKG